MFFKHKTTEFEYLIVGLGNPGLTYENTRHNAGFAAVDALLSDLKITLKKHKFDAVYGDALIGKKRVIIAKPQTFMNNSGRAVRAISRFYRIQPKKIIILFDDISLPVGNIRIRRKGSDGGHNGIKDIIELLGTEDIMRIKIGVGKKPNPDYDLRDWVLGKIPKSEFQAFSAACENAANAVKEIIIHGIDSAMNKYSK
ncbi:MAG: aminoacyl-tRNA hydrolase [Clostridia bacterium]|nr:aminoacyl-tRNA hydrolase [Clostridia bacterium]